MAVTVEIVFSETPAAGASTPTLSFEDLYSRWYRDLVEFCRRTGCGDSDPEDVAQEAFLKAWSAWGDYRENRPVWPWLMTIAKRCCVDHWRRRTRAAHRQECLDGVQQLPLMQPDEVVVAAEEQRFIGAAFQQLRPGERRVVGLQVIEGWSYNEIAEFENVTTDSVRATLHRARGTLRRAYLRTIESSPIVVVAGRLTWSRGGSASARARRMLAFFDPTTVERAAVAVFGAATIAVAVVGIGGDGSQHEAAGSAVAKPTQAAAAAGGGSAEPADAAGAGIASRPVSHGSASGTGASGAPSAAGGSSSSPQAGGGGRLPIDRSDTPDDGYITSFATSPGDPDTVFAAGSASGGCEALSCPALFKSDDAGASWRRLEAVGYTAGTIVVPPNYPADPRIFVAGSSSLQVSTDGGKTFTALAPVGGAPAMSPAFSNGDRRILLGSGPGWEYRDSDVGIASPVTWSTLAGTARAFAFSPAYSVDDRILVRGSHPGLDGPNQSAVQVCQATSCSVPAMLAGSTGQPELTLSPSFLTSGTAIAWRAKAMFRSRDGGLSFEPLASPVSGAIIRNAVFGPDESLYVSVAHLDNEEVGGLFVSTDGGDSWRQLGAVSLGRKVSTMLSLADGRLLAARSAGKAGGGVLCSMDGGQTWTPRCAQAA